MSREADLPGNRIVLIATVSVLMALVACSSGSDGDTARVESSEQVEGSEQDDAPSIPEPFEGDVEEFYRVPDPLPDGEPGDLIRIQPLETDSGEEGTRIMYLSEDRTGAPRAVTGTVHH